MQWTIGRRRFAAWLAMLAMLLGSVAPLVSHALQQSGGAPWVEVCSAVGAEAARSDTSAPAQGLAKSLDHCPYCMPQVSAPALISAPQAGRWIDSDAVHALAQPPENVAVATPAWLRGQPRAPPSHG